MNSKQTFLFWLFVVGMIALIISILGMHNTIKDTKWHDLSFSLMIGSIICIIVATIGASIFPIKDKS